MRQSEVNDIAYNTAYAVEVNRHEELEIWLELGETFNTGKVTAAQRKRAAEHVGGWLNVMSANSFGKRSGEACALVARFGTAKAAMAAIEAFNNERIAANRNAMSSLQNLKAELVDGRSSGKASRKPASVRVIDLVDAVSSASELDELERAFMASVAMKRLELAGK
jgi:hypothetical protein